MPKDNTPQPDASGSGGKSDYQTLGTFLSRTFTALTNAQLPAIEPLLTARGISPADVQARLLDVQNLQALNQKKPVEYGEQYEATAVFNLARATVNEEYIDHVELARIAFRKDLSAQKALGLQGKRKRSKGDYIAQGIQFYKNASGSAAYRTALAKKGVSQADLQAGQVAFENLQTLSAAQAKETGEAQAATAARDAVYGALAKWMSDFYATAKIALRKHPQLMEQLGIVERS